MKIIGAMSGSSLDGLDLAICSFQESELNALQWEVLETKTFPFPSGLADQLAVAKDLSVKACEKLGIELADFTAKCVKQLSNWHSCSAVAIHGHTIHHEPEVGYSLQITNPWYLFRAIELPVIADFRNADIALGGQGAPLVPKPEMELFPEFDAFLNLGGIANATLLAGETIEAYDICACNQWLNTLSNRLDYDFDKDGILSSKGNTIPELLKACHDWDFCHQAPPKSLSNEACSNFYSEVISSYLKDHSVEDVMKSCVVFMAEIIGKVLKKASKVLVTGGGVYNKTLISELRKYVDVEIPSNEIVEFKEAIAFAYLGFCKLNALPGNVPKATGASREAVLGCLYNF